MKTVLAFAALLAAFQSQAAIDAGGDLLSTFAGTPSAALDIRAADVSFDAAAGTFTLHASTAGALAGEPGVAFVFGFDRGGAANQPFGPIGFADVRFNAAVTLRADGTGSLGSNAITAAVSGRDIFGVVPAALLAPNGRTPEQFTFAVWAVDTRVTGLPRNADFLGTGNFAVAAVPEPGGVALMLAGLGAIGAVVRRRSVRR